MERLYFADIADLAEYMVNRVEDKKYIVSALFFDNATELMRSLLLYDDVRIGMIELADHEYDGYTDEYYVTLTDDYTLCVERAMSEERYLGTDAALILLDGDAKYAIVNANDRSECIELVIGEDDYDEYESDESDDCIEKIFDAVRLIFDPDNNTSSFGLDIDRLFKSLFN